MFTTIRPALGGALLLLLAGVLLQACSDNTVEPVDHFEAVGLVLVRQGVDSVIVDSARVRGSLEVGTNDTTGYFDIYYLREDTRARDLPTSDDFTFGWSIADTSLVTLQPPASDGHDHAHYEFRLIGKKAGSTTLTLKLLHNGHDDFLTPPIAVTVAP